IKNAPAVESVYLMTEDSLRQYPWVNFEDYVKTGRLKAGTVFKNDEESAYAAVSPAKNQMKSDLWTAPVWSETAKSWVVSYYGPVYSGKNYKGAVGADVSVNMLFESVLYKKYEYNSAVPLVISASGRLVASSPSGYKLLKIEADVKSSAKTNLAAGQNQSLAKAVSSAASGKNGIEAVLIEGTEYLLFYYPIGTADLALGILVNTQELASSAIGPLSAVKSVKEGGETDNSIMIVSLAGFMLAVLLSLVLTRSLSGSSQKQDPSQAGINKASLEAEKKDFQDKMFSLEKKNSNLQENLSKIKEELEKFRGRSSARAPEKGGAKYITEEDTEEGLVERPGAFSGKAGYKVDFGDMTRKPERANTANQEENGLEDARLQEIENGKQELLARLKDIELANDKMAKSLNTVKEEKEGLVRKVSALEVEAKDITFKLVDRFEQEKARLKVELQELSNQVREGVRAGESELVNLQKKAEEERKEYNGKISALESNLKVFDREREYFKKTSAELEDRNKALQLALDGAAERMKQTASPAVQAAAETAGRAEKAEAERMFLEKKLKELGESNEGYKKALIDLQEKVKADLSERVGFESQKKEYETKKAGLEKLYVDSAKSSEAAKAAGERLAKLETENRELSAKAVKPEEAKKLPEAKPKTPEFEKKTQEESAVKPPALPSFKSTAKPTEGTAAGEEERNILVVDDEGSVIKIFGDLVYNLGYSLYITRNGRSAIQKLALGNYKFVILNSRMPDISPKELYENIVSADKNFEKQIIFFLGDDANILPFHSGKKILRAVSSEADVKKLLG
ncbi:MAG: hypothetical protein WCI43_00245, partial [Candidatus Firestonebacteria bacterium]